MPFTKKATFVVQTSQMPASQTDFPFLIYWTDDSFKHTGSGGPVTSSSGYDIRPYSDINLTSPLTYSLFEYSTGGTVGMRIKNTGGVGTTIYLGIGDASITTDGSSTSTFSNSFAGFYDFGPTGSLTLTDRSGGNNGTNNNSVSSTAGKIGGSANFSAASSQSISLATPADFAIGSSFTIMCWVNINSGADRYICGFGENTAGQGMDIFWNNSNSRCDFDIFGAGTATGSTVTSGAWHHIAWVHNSSGPSQTFYIDGSSAGSGGTGTISAPSSPSASIGRVPWSANFYDGLIDEFSFSTTNRSANWIASTYNNENSQSTFWGTPTFETISSGVLMGQRTFRRRGR